MYYYQIQVFSLKNMLFTAKDDSKIYPNTGKVVLGSNTSFYCDSSVLMEWYFLKKIPEKINTLAIKPFYYTYVRKLFIYNISLKNSGYYICYSKYHHNNDYFIATAKLKVYGKFGYYFHILNSGKDGELCQS